MTRTIRTAAELDALPVGSVVRGTAFEYGPAATIYVRQEEFWYAGWGVDEEAYFDLPVVVLHDPSAPAPAPSVVPDAAVEAAASAVRKERAFSAAAAFGVPMDGVPQCAEMIARAALTAALPFLTAAPSEVERIARALTEATALTGADALRIVQAAQAMSAPSATHDEVARALEGEFGCFLARDPHRPDAFWGGAADALLARYNMTLKEDR